MIEATWSVDEDSGKMDEGSPCYASLNDEHSDTYRFDAQGHYGPEENICRVNWVMPHYMPSSVYTLNFVRMRDRARNTGRVYFGNPGHGLRQEDSIVDEDGPQIELVTDNPDTEPPELDVENISIHAEPTRPDNPDGETLVTLQFSVSDNISGFTAASLFLRDPQGIDHHFYALAPDRSHLFPSGDTSQWNQPYFYCAPASRVRAWDMGTRGDDSQGPRAEFQSIRLHRNHPFRCRRPISNSRNSARMARRRTIKMEEESRIPVLRAKDRKWIRLSAERF